MEDQQERDDDDDDEGEWKKSREEEEGAECPCVLSKGRGVNKSTPCSQVPGLGALLVLLNAG